MTQPPVRSPLSSPRGYLLAGLLLLPGVACQRSASDPSELRGVVLVVIDTLRADHLGSYGYERETSPRIDGFAADATQFANAITPAPWTLPAVASLMTSLYPSVHGAGQPTRDARRASQLGEGRTTWAEILQGAGFQTAAFVQGAYPRRLFGLAQGFEHFVEDQPGVRFNIEALLRWLDEEQPERFFVYLHTVEVHAPYMPTDPFRRLEALGTDVDLESYREAVEEEKWRLLDYDFDPGYRGSVDGSLELLRSLPRRRSILPRRDLDHLVALYDRGIAYTDYWVGRLLEGLRERGLFDRCVVVITSDHGEEFFEHGNLQHTRTYFDELLRVPLLIRVPWEGRGDVVRSQVGLVDVLPTILDVLDLDSPPWLQGRSFRPLWQGGELPKQALSVESGQHRRSHALRTDRFKYVDLGDGRKALYDLERDPGETENRCAEEPEVCRSFERQMGARRQLMLDTVRSLALAEPSIVELDPEHEARLRELGYLASDP